MRHGNIAAHMHRRRLRTNLGCAMAQSTSDAQLASCEQAAYTAAMATAMLAHVLAANLARAF